MSVEPVNNCAARLIRFMAPALHMDRQTLARQVEQRERNLVRCAKESRAGCGDHRAAFAADRAGRRGLGPRRGDDHRGRAHLAARFRAWGLLMRHRRRPKPAPCPALPSPPRRCCVVSVTPADATHRVDGSQPVTITFSAPLAAGSPKPRITPDVQGTWDGGPRAARWCSPRTPRSGRIPPTRCGSRRGRPACARPRAVCSARRSPTGSTPSRIPPCGCRNSSPSSATCR